ncbi:MAG: BrnT family toxin [Deltaproteobacteria bacterium]|nr:BrnT family toxin [Deltaproteobacteria bacterium]
MKVISHIKWTETSLEHISRHGVSPEEVEETCFNEDDEPLIRSGRENLHYVFGKTYSGRFLFVVVRFIRQGEVRVITARDMNAWEKNYFRKRGK